MGGQGWGGRPQFHQYYPTRRLTHVCFNNRAPLLAGRGGPGQHDPASAEEPAGSCRWLGDSPNGFLNVFEVSWRGGAKGVVAAPPHP